MTELNAFVDTQLALPSAPRKAPKAPAISPTSLTLKHLRKQGYQLVAVTEKWNPHARIRQDLFGIIDVLAIRGTEILAVQATSGANVSARVDKLTEHESTPIIRAANIRLVVHGWRKSQPSGRWTLREVDLS